jgi:CelD/BcsL family acetyltransferase involved in cellulose biosynthesis
MVTGKLSVHVATTVQNIEELRPWWRNWAHSLDTDVDYFLHKLRNDPQILRPYGITVYDDGIPQAMLLGQVRQHRVSAIVSFVNIPGPYVKALEINKSARIGRASAVIDKLLAGRLGKAVKDGDVDLLCFQRLALRSELFRQVQQLTGLLFKERVLHVFYYSELSLTPRENKPPEVFSGKTMREVRRKTRILERAFPGQVRLKCFSHASELDAGIRDAMRVAVTTWQYYLATGLSDTAHMRKTLRFFARQGWLRIYILYAKDVPCAYLVGQVYNKTFYCQYAGYQPKFANFSVGSVLTARAFEELAAEGVLRVDLGEGGQEHNRRLGCQKSEEGTVHMYSPSLRGVWLSLFFGAMQTVRTGGSRTRSALQLNRLSKIWQQYCSQWQSRRRSFDSAAHRSA